MELVGASVLPDGLSGFADSRWIANETVSQINTASASEKSFSQKSLKIKSRMAGHFAGISAEVAEVVSSCFTTTGSGFAR